MAVKFREKNAKRSKRVNEKFEKNHGAMIKHTEELKQKHEKRDEIKTKK